MQRHVTNLCGVFALALLATAARAETLEGEVRNAGAGINLRVLLTEHDGLKGPALCPNDVAKRAGKLSSMKLKATGDWKLDGKGAKDCFEATDFAVLQAASGREAVVGKLEKKDDVYVLTGDDGKTRTLTNIPDGLKKLDGQKVILDLRSMANPVAKETTDKVVTYQTFP